MLRHKVGELGRERGLTYSKFARRAGVGMQTARELYKNPYYLLEPPTLIKCCRFFGVEPGEILELDEQSKQSSIPY